MKKLYRSVKDKKIAGICGGIGEIYQVDPNVIRVGLVFVTLITQLVPVVAAYLVGWILLPEGPEAE